MNHYAGNIEQSSLDNSSYREVLFTGQHLQLVVMSIPPGGDIGEEVHTTTDQFLRVEAGEGVAIIDGEETALEDGFAVLVPAGAEHNIRNTSKTDELKMYTLYSPPHHKDGTIHATKEDAMNDEEDHL